ncbi:MAG: hypothetical protein JW768_11685 [Chitinispirillaceae bacterium]|nr:hypothetical protein [Chitinispirillaceae bacterium]
MTLDELDAILRTKGYPSRNELGQFPLGSMLLDLDSCAWTTGNRVVELYDRENPNSRDLGRDEQDLSIQDLEERLREQERILGNERILEVYRQHMHYMIKAAVLLTTNDYFRILERYDIWSIEPFASYGRFLQSRKPDSLLGPQESYHRKFLRFAALYHDIGKIIHRERHGVLGKHLLETLEDTTTREVRDLLRRDGQDYFALLVEMIGNHDLFGMLCTGEASRPVLLDLLRLKDPVRALGGLATLTIADIYSTLKIRSLRMDLRIFQTVLDDWKFIVDQIQEETKREPILFQTGMEKLLLFYVQQREYAAERIRRIIISAIFMLTEIRGMWGTPADQRAIEDAISAINSKLNKRSEQVTIAELRWLSTKVARKTSRDALETCIEAVGKGSYAGKEIGDALILVRRECGVSQEEIKVWARKVTADVVLDALRKRLGSRIVGFCDSFALVCKFNYTLRFVVRFVQAWIDAKVAIMRLQDQIVAPKKLFEMIDARELTAIVVELFVRLTENYQDLTLQKGQHQRRIGIELRGITRPSSIAERIVDLLQSGRSDEAMNWIVDEATAWYF